MKHIVTNIVIPAMRYNLIIISHCGNYYRVLLYRGNVVECDLRG